VTVPALPDLPTTFDGTREALHLVAARVLAAARFAAVGRMGLEVVPGGFGTPEFEGRQLLVVDGMLSDGARRQPLTTLLDAYAFAGVDPTGPLHPVLDLPADPGAPLRIDLESARVLAVWFAFCQSRLEELLVDAGDGDEPSVIQLWPEHFDLAFDEGAPGARATYGGSPGDGFIDQPYLYVGPHDTHQGPFWSAPFGAALTYDEIRGGSTPAAFFSQGQTALGVR
jgi:hypothetical protein